MYIPLYIKTNYSLLSSLIDIDSLIKYAKDKQLPYISIVDNNMYGVIEFYQKCLKNNLKPIIGLDIIIDNQTVLLYAKNYEGYQSLMKISTIQSERPLTLLDIEKHYLSLIVILPCSSINLYKNLLKIFPDLYIGYTNKEEEKKLIGKDYKLVFINKALYLNENDQKYLKYLYLIRDGKTIADEAFKNEYNNNALLTDVTGIDKDSIFNTEEIANQCHVIFPPSKLELPIYNNLKDQYDYLVKLSIAGLKKRLTIVNDIYQNRLKYELEIINEMGFSNYFLIVYDFIKFAKQNNILVGPGRGSAAGSLVSYSLGITDVDPIKYDLLFERFLNPNRVTMPDIDTDFPDVYRDQIIEYVTNKYGNKKVAGIITFGTLGGKQVLRDVGRILNIPIYKIDELSKLINFKETLKQAYQNNINLSNIIDSEDRLKLLYDIAIHIEKFPRHTSVHAAGIVMSKCPLDETIPLVYNNNSYITAYSMDYLEDLGLLKMDFLGLKNLTTIMNIIKDINLQNDEKIDFNKIPLNDSKTLKLFADGKTLGIFQFESEGMRKFLKKLKPSCFEDLFAANALFRPGPSNNIDTYIKRRHGKEEATYIDERLKPILKNTYGIIIYQEQIMQIASLVASYTLGEADILRRAMSKKNKEIILKEKNKFIESALKNDYSFNKAEEIFSLILKFANYGFNRSHSVAYSIIAYKMGYLKAHYPKYFYSNLLTSVIGSEIKTKEYIYELKANQLEILHPDINLSMDYYTVSDEGIRLPLSAIRSVGIIAAKDIINSRQKEPFEDIFDFISRTKTRSITKRVLESLINASCFKSFSYNKATLHSNIDNIINYGELTNELDKEFVLKPEIDLVNEYSDNLQMQQEKELFGFYLKDHPVTKCKNKYQNIINLKDIANYYNKIIDLIVLIDNIKVITTKNNEEMAFITGSDEESNIELLLFPKIYQKNNNFQKNDVILIKGKVEKRFDKIQVIVNNIKKAY